MAGLPEPLIVAEWWKNRGGESVRVQLSTFKDCNIVDVRVWRADKVGMMRPGRGISLRIQHLPRLIDALTTALDKARSLNLFRGEQS
jgi:hypothetical protein